MNIPGMAFRPARWATLLMLAGVALTVALGVWQLGRAQTKQALQSRLNDHAKESPIAISANALKAETVLLRRVEVRGYFEPRHMVFIDNRLYKHQPGYHVLMPVRISGSDKHVLVNRGWIAAGSQRNHAPAVKTPAGEIVVRGTAVPFSERYIELSNKVTEGNIWQNMVIERYRQATRLDVQPIIVQQTEFGEPFDDGLVRDWPPVDLKRNTHLAYAVQWFAMAAAIFIYYVIVHVRRKSGVASN